jgi:hypothetical protein
MVVMPGRIGSQSATTDKSSPLVSPHCHRRGSFSGPVSFAVSLKVLHNYYMRCSTILLALGAFSLATAQASFDEINFNGFTPSTIIKSTGLTDCVQWDGYSLFVDEKRALVFSGEIHRELLSGTA